jgi:hypothetical protein
MTYARFEDIPVWQQAIRLAEAAYDLTASPGWQGPFSLRDQIERAALSMLSFIERRPAFASFKSQIIRRGGSTMPGSTGFMRMKTLRWA